MKRILCLCAALGGLGYAWSGAAKDRVTWGIGDFPPSFIINGPWAGKGTADEELRYLTSHLVEFDHAIIVLTLPRLWHLMAHGDGICAPAAFKTEERKKLAVFSRAALINFSPRLLTRKENVGKFAPYRDADGAVELDKLLSRDDLTGAYQVTRSYGTDIDRLIAGAPRRPIGLQDTRQALEMVIRGHADFTFGAPTEISYLALERNIDPGLTQLPVAGQEPFTFGYVACSNGPVGRKVVERVNRLLGKQTAQLPYLRASARWYAADDLAEMMGYTEWPR